MNSTLVMTPVPETLAAFKRSQGIAVGSGEAAFCRSSPLTELLSLDFQVGPAPWPPMSLPDASVSTASGA